ncbi:prolyl oligopeptidase family serine peptidase [Paenarthrobacter sp. DKR-5]|uniref:alpha/beta hydrolase family protein n=1 Tax=Paenarthrobacter sp. DKR-5 TaxID=2835535 RepID=UPI001BDD4BBA|nr:prolyl oligopeptidase family serine peptidase [Paenarthrobacter sp. DKR-5]MBT1003250.1 prolyl oligopeptidase family serine peptidase [Paenarthrobacter sp. DKR-5]
MSARGSGEPGQEPLRHSYGPDPSQFGELFLPAEEAAGVVVVVHGGYWRARYGAELGRPLAADLASHGYAAWNLEYRRAGNGGGWPRTFEDIAAGIDALLPLSRRHGFGLDRVAALGHSAGGHLAVWAAGRSRFHENTPGAHPAVQLTGVVAQSGVLDLRAADALHLSEDAASAFMGGSAAAAPEAYAAADPMQHLPLDIPVYAVHGMEDDTVPLEFSAAYARAAAAAGAVAELVLVPGHHFDLIDPRAEAYRRCRELLDVLLRP